MEAFWLFKEVIEQINRDPTAKQQPVTVEKVGRNEPCPCGSGKKYKHCHKRT